MTRRKMQLVALLAIAAMTQAACYNTYFIDKSELEKLESEVEQKEVVTVNADCAGATASNANGLEGTVFAQAEKEAGDDTATDATAAGTAEAEAQGQAGCTSVPVSTANPVTVVTENGTEYRVTPFNFMMSQQQLVSPEYDLLLSLDQVKGAEVQQFSTWKTTATIVGVSAVAIGSFIGISILAPEGGGFAN